MRRKSKFRKALAWLMVSILSMGLMMPTFATTTGPMPPGGPIISPPPQPIEPTYAYSEDGAYRIAIPCMPTYQIPNAVMGTININYAGILEHKKEDGTWEPATDKDGNLISVTTEKSADTRSDARQEEDPPGHAIVLAPQDSAFTFDVEAKAIVTVYPEASTAEPKPEPIEVRLKIKQSVTVIKPPSIADRYDIVNLDGSPAGTKLYIPIGTAVLNSTDILGPHQQYFYANNQAEKKDLSQFQYKIKVTDQYGEPFIMSAEENDKVKICMEPLPGGYAPSGSYEDGVFTLNVPKDGYARTINLAILKEMTMTAPAATAAPGPVPFMEVYSNTYQLLKTPVILRDDINNTIQVLNQAPPLEEKSLSPVGGLISRDLFIAGQKFTETPSTAASADTKLEFVPYSKQEAAPLIGNIVIFFAYKLRMLDRDSRDVEPLVSDNPINTELMTPVIMTVVSPIINGSDSARGSASVSLTRVEGDDSDYFQALTNGDSKVKVKKDEDRPFNLQYSINEEYKIGENGTWTEYKTPLTITQTSTIFARTVVKVIFDMHLTESAGPQNILSYSNITSKTITITTARPEREEPVQPTVVPTPIVLPTPIVPLAPMAPPPVITVPSSPLADFAYLDTQLTNDATVIEDPVTPEGALNPAAIAPVTLPKTGEFPLQLWYGIGGMLAAAGLYLRRKN